MLCRGVQAFIVFIVLIACVSSSDYRRRERYSRRNYEERPSRETHSILSRGEDGHGYELQLDGNSHITSYLKAIDVPEPLYRNPHIIASFDESIIPAALARRLAQRRASEEAAAATVESNQSTSNNQTHDGAKPKDNDDPTELSKPVEVTQTRVVEPEGIRQEKESLMVKEPEVAIKTKDEQLNPLENRLQIGGRVSESQMEKMSKYQEAVDDRKKDIPLLLRESSEERRPTIRVTQMNTQEFRERGRGSVQEPREFVLLMDSDRSSSQPTLYGNLRPRTAAPRKHQSSRQTMLVPVPMEQNVRDHRSQTFRAAQLGSAPSQMKLLQIVPDEPETRLRGQLVKEVREEMRDQPSNNGMEEMRYQKSSSQRSPLINSCLQLCSCCSALMGKNIVPLLV